MDIYGTIYYNKTIKKQKHTNERKGKKYENRGDKRVARYNDIKFNALH